jgi:hypothetical protein
MSDAADFYRRQADEYLAKAERAELIGKIAQLPVGSVIRWTECEGQYSYVALAVEVPRSGGRWDTTSSMGNGQSFVTTDQLVSRLVDRNSDVYVVDSWGALADWSDSPDVDTDATQMAETAQTDTDR